LWICTFEDPLGRPVVTVEAPYPYGWAKNGEQLLYRSGEADEQFCWFAVDIKSGKSVQLTPARSAGGHPIQARWRGLVFNQNQSALRPDEILLGLNARNQRLYDAWLVNTRTGERRLVAKADDDADMWLVDDRLNVLGVKTNDADGGSSIHIFQPDGSRRRIYRWDEEDALASRVLTFEGASRWLYLIDTTGRDTGALCRLDIDSGELKTIAGRDNSEIVSVSKNPISGEVDAVWVADERHHWEGLTEDVRTDLRILAEESEGVPHVAGRSRDDRCWLVGYARDDGPAWIAMYVREKRRVNRLFTIQPALEGQPLVKHKPVSYRARDGLLIHGYLSQPRNVNPPGPLVMLVHGGPEGRDYWGFNAEAQWLANRGFACLQVNFRGSTGYGKRFLNAGDREWGRRMQDDLTDAVGWAIAAGIADPKRVAIMGQSYGGYAALCGVAFTPELYAGAVCLCGIADLIAMLRDAPPVWHSRREQYARRIGRLPVYAAGDNAGKMKPKSEWTAAECEDVERLRAASPLTHAERITAPVLIAHGAHDPRCRADQTAELAGRLQNLGRDCEHVVYEDEGHWLAKQENRLDFYRRAERFLKRVLA